MADQEAVLNAYRECERITREQARNFSWGIRLLPAPKRTALSAVYAMARRIDDIGDGTLPRGEKLRLLADARAAAIRPGEHPRDPVLVALDDAARRLPIPLAAFGDLVDGCEMDVLGRSYDTLDELVEYCRCVAGSIGRLSLGVFDPGLIGEEFVRAVELADALGVALQLTNILRDIREDLGNGRIYLPKQDLDLFGCVLATRPDGTLDPQGGALAEVIRFEAARAWGWYDRGMQLLDLLDRRSAACCAAMAGIYRELLQRIAADPDAVMRGRTSLPGRDKLRVAARALAGVAVVDGRAVVVGGGLAGIAAALRLADSGRDVVLLEKRPRLGGAAFSFARDGLSVDNGQHVFLRCCEAYRWLLGRLRVEHDVILQERLDIPVLRSDGRRARLSRLPGVPAPAHLGAALAGYRLLGPADRLRVIRGALALRRLDPGDRGLDARTLGAFLHEHGQNDATISGLWGILATATLNLAPDEASLALAAKVFRTGLLDHAPASDVGYAAVPLSRLHSSAASAALAAAGVEVLVGHAVDAVEAGGTVRAHSSSGDERTWLSDTVVLAVPHRDAFTAAPALATSDAAPAAGLGASPIVNVHVVYDRRVTDLPFAAAVDSPVQWFFDRTKSSGLPAIRPRGQYLAVTVSAAESIIDEPSRAVIARFVAELARLVPDAARAQVVDAFVTRERRATFRQAAGSWALRPGTAAGPEGVWLAGAWTDTGWPDTMEGAVRSGITAAEAALQIPAHQATEFAA